MKFNFICSLLGLTLIGITNLSCNTPYQYNYNQSVITTEHKQGILKPSDKATDFAIDGRGFFCVTDPATGKEYYTRDGSFSINEKEQLSAKNGYLLNPVINIKKGQAFSIDYGGKLYIKDEKGLVEIGQIIIATFPHPEGLTQPMEVAHTNFYAVSPASGDPVLANPGVEKFGVIIENALEDLSMMPIPVPNKNCYKEFSNIEQKQPPEYQKTGKATDWAIDGRGFFVVRDPLTGQSYYTRSNSFTKLDYSGRLGIVMNSFNSKEPILSMFNYELSSSITIPEGQTFSKIDENGKIWVKGSDNKLTGLGQVNIAIFEKPEKLKPLGFARSNFYLAYDESLASTESGDPVITLPNQNGAGFIVSGYLQNCSD